MALLEEFNIDRFTIRTGFALVIVNKNFQSSAWLPDRPGAEVDRTRIKTFCINNSCTPQVYDDLTEEEIRDVCKKISKLDFSAYDGFLFFLSTHGDGGNVIFGVDGESVPVDYIVSQFKKKQTLVNKPKLFFMQNCRGRNVDRGQTVHVNQNKVQADHGANVRSEAVRHPVEADILVAYSSSDGYESYRNTVEGSWFITTLIDVADELLHRLNLTDMLSLVNKKVAVLNTEGKKQMPCFTSSLRKPVYFTRGLAAEL